jgi:hypothetical protein
MNVSGIRKYFFVSLFIVLTLIAGVIFWKYMFVIFGLSAILLTVPEKHINKLVLFLFLFIAIIINTTDYRSPKLKDNFLYNLVNNPVSENFLVKIVDKDSSYDIIKKIKYPENDEGQFSYIPKSIEDKINLSIYYLMKKNFDKFKETLPSEYINDPLVLLSLSSYYFNTFQYSEMEKINKQLYEYPFLYKISEDYHQFTNKALFLQYSDEIEISLNDGSIIFDSRIFIIAILTIVIFVIAFLISRKYEFFKCTSCGDFFCISCDDGFEHNQVCDACKNIYNVKHSAEASILVKKRITIENYQYNLKRFSKFLSTLLPGAGHIYLNKPIFGSFLTLFFSFIIFMAVFRFEPFMVYENLAVHIIFFPVYLFIIGVFLIFYLISIFYRK